MGLRDEMALYTEMSGNDGNHTPIGIIGAYLDGYEKGKASAPEPHWIPCREGMPKEHNSIWAKAKGTEKWREPMWEKQSDEVVVTEVFEDGTTRTDTACTHDGEWYVKVKAVKREIIAWMPLPEPYKENNDEDHGRD